MFGSPPLVFFGQIFFWSPFRVRTVDFWTPIPIQTISLLPQVLQYFSRMPNETTAVFQKSTIFFFKLFRWFPDGEFAFSL